MIEGKYAFQSSMRKGSVGAEGELPGTYTAARLLNECGLAFEVRKVCADFEEPLAFQGL